MCYMHWSVSNYIVHVRRQLSVMTMCSVMGLCVVAAARRGGRARWAGLLMASSCYFFTKWRIISWHSNSRPPETRIRNTSLLYFFHSCLSRRLHFDRCIWLFPVIIYNYAIRPQQQPPPPHDNCSWKKRPELMPLPPELIDEDDLISCHHPRHWMGIHLDSVLNTLHCTAAFYSVWSDVRRLGYNC